MNKDFDRKNIQRVVAQALKGPTSELHVRGEAGDDVLGEVFREAEVIEGMEGAMKATIVGDGSGLIEIDIRVALQVVEGELVEVQLAGRGVLDDQIALGFEGKILDFIELIDADVTSQALSILNHLAGKIGTDARDGLQSSGVGCVEHDMFALADLGLVMSHHRVAISIWKAMAPLIGRIAIDDLRADINRPLTISLMAKTVAIVFRRLQSIDEIGRNERI